MPSLRLKSRCNLVRIIPIITVAVAAACAPHTPLVEPSDTGQWPAVDRNDPQMIVDLETLPGGSRATAPVIGTMQRSDP